MTTWIGFLDHNPYQAQRIPLRHHYWSSYLLPHCSEGLPEEVPKFGAYYEILWDDGTTAAFRELCQQFSPGRPFPGYPETVQIGVMYKNGACYLVLGSDNPYLPLRRCLP